MLRLFTDIANDGLTPNGLYFLMAVTEGSGIQLINYHSEKRILETAGFIADNKITEAGYNAIEKYKKLYKTEVTGKVKKKVSFNAQDEEQIHQYREIFPKGILPSGNPSRLAYKELEKRFQWFFANYDYKWDTILKATKIYVNKYKDDNYLYMKTSGYFIVKHEKGVEVSTLATYCEMVLEGAKEQTPTNTDGYSSAI